MKKVFGLFALVVAVASASGCGKGKSGETVDTYVSGMDKIADAVASVQDEASARQAARVIAGVSAELSEFAQELEAMNAAERTAMFMARAEELQKTQMRLASAMQSLAAKPDLLKIISDEMNEMPGVQ